MVLMAANTGELKPGMVTTAQLGNPSDFAWSPEAAVLVLQVIKQPDSDQCYTLISKIRDGQYRLHMYARERSAECLQNSPGRGRLYSTTTYIHHVGEYNGLLSPEQNKTVERLIFEHASALKELPMLEYQPGSHIRR